MTTATTKAKQKKKKASKPVKVRLKDLQRKILNGKWNAVRNTAQQFEAAQQDLKVTALSIAGGDVDIKIEDGMPVLYRMPAGTAAAKEKKKEEEKESESKK